MNELNDHIILTTDENFLSIAVIAQDQNDQSAWSTPLKHKFRLINGVPVLFISTADNSDIFFFGLNYIQLKEKGPSNWLEQENLQLDISLRNHVYIDKIEPLQTVILTKAESDQIRQACLAQTGSSEFIDAAFEFLYNYPTKKLLEI